ncbi:C4b-binding protein alpha chain-like isoform X2 [Osmerus eperlanus]|uniref:C4b-binding protein alpha chain-like isoform X2 n=1 Tax=Osmerus eperlanus TaxID=29151 RepID=UPI002E148079
MQSIDARRCWLLASGLCLAYMVGTVQGKNCGSPGEILNGQFNIDNGTEFGDITVAKCNTGYKLIGSARRQCMDGGWSGRIPTCEVSKCGPAPQVVNGKPSSNEESYDYDAVIRYNCNPGFTLKGSKSILCKGDEVFEPAPPQCIKVECPAPDVQNAIVIDGASAPYGYKSFLTYRCKAGFVMHGADSITCEIESEWNPPIPECRDTGVIVGAVIGTLVQSTAALLLIHYSLL